MSTQVEPEVTGAMVELATTDLGSVPAAALEAAKLLIIDTLTCAVAGSAEESAYIPASIFSEAGGTPAATIIGVGPCSGRRVPVLGAVYANAHAANVLDADDTVRYTGHIGSATVPAALAFAEREGATGLEFLAAVALGYEVAARIGSSMRGLMIGPDGEARFAKVTGYSWTGFASTVAAGRLLGLGQGEMRHAFGIAGSTIPAPGSTPFGTSLPRPMTKYLMYGQASHAGALAALLAQRGFTGEHAILDGETGLWQTLGSLGCDRDALRAPTDGRWAVEDACYKPYPACRFNGVAIDLFLQLIAEHGIDPDEIESVDVEVPAAGLRKHRADLFPAASLVDATFSLPHLLGAAAYAGRPGPRWLSAEARTSPLIAELAARTTVAAIAGAGEKAAEDLHQHGHLTRMPTRVSIHAGGRVFAMAADYARGDVYEPSLAFGVEDLSQKLTDFCGDLLPAQQLIDLVDVAVTLEQQPHVGGLIEALVAREAAS